MATGALGRTYEDGEVIVRQGEKDDCMYVVQQGQVRVVIERDGIDHPLAVRGEGEVIGEMALFDGKSHSATVRALGAARILRVDKRNFLIRVQEDPSLVFHVVENMCARIRELSERLARYEAQ